MINLLSILTEQRDLETGILTFLDSPEFSCYQDIIQNVVQHPDELSLKQIRLLNLISSSENLESSVSSIPPDLVPIYEDLLQKNILASYRTCPLGKMRKIEYPTVTFPTPSVAYFISSRKPLILKAAKVKADAKANEAKVKADEAKAKADEVKTRADATADEEFKQAKKNIDLE